MSALPTICPPDRVPFEGETIFSRVTSRSKPDYAIDPVTGCWVWQKFLTKRGYASRHAHRLYWERANGPIPDGWHVHHVCENTACVNPAHLEAVPAHTHFLHHLGKLDAAAVDEIRALGDQPGVRAIEVAERYGIGKVHVYRIWNGQRRQHEIGDERSEPTEPWPCANPNCDELILGKRNKRFCDQTCNRQAQRVARQQRRRNDKA